MKLIASLTAVVLLGAALFVPTASASPDDPIGDALALLRATCQNPPINPPMSDQVPPHLCDLLPSGDPPCLDGTPIQPIIITTNRTIDATIAGCLGSYITSFLCFGTDPTVTFPYVDLYTSKIEAHIPFSTAKGGSPGGIYLGLSTTQSC